MSSDINLNIIRQNESGIFLKLKHIPSLVMLLQEEYITFICTSPQTVILKMSMFLVIS